MGYSYKANRNAMIKPVYTFISFPLDIGSGITDAGGSIVDFGIDLGDSIGDLGKLSFDNVLGKPHPSVM